MSTQDDARELIKALQEALPAGARSVLLAMLTAEDADELEDAEVLIDGGQAYVGQRRTNASTVFRLEQACVLRADSHNRDSQARRYSLNEEGRSIARAERERRAMLQDRRDLIRDRELNALRELNHQGKYDDPDGWRRPMDVGGSDGSHHSATLNTLTRRGFVQRQQRAGYSRGSCLYRITDAGRTWLKDQG